MSDVERFEMPELNEIAGVVKQSLSPVDKDAEITALKKRVEELEALEGVFDRIERQTNINTNIIKRDYPETGEAYHVIELLNQHILDAVTEARKALSQGGE